MESGMFRLFKESKVGFQRKTQVLTDTGYQGLHKIYSNSQLPKKKTKKKPLRREEQKESKKLVSQ